MAVKPTMFQPSRTPMPLTGASTASSIQPVSSPTAAPPSPTSAPGLTTPMPATAGTTQPGSVTNLVNPDVTAMPTGNPTAPTPGTTPTTPAPVPTPTMAPGAPANGPQPGAPTTPGTAGPPPTGVSQRAWDSFNNINSGISLAQWQAWDQYADPTCPGNKPYRGQKMINGQTDGSCEETPDNCPDGFQAYGQNECRTNAEVAALTGGGGAGGAGGPGGSGGGGGAGIPGSGSYNSQNDYLWQALMDRMTQGSRYDPATMATLEAATKESAEGAAQSQTEDLNNNLASRGLARSGVATPGYQAIRANAGNQVLQAKSTILKAKIDADYQDQSDTLAKMQDWINGQRSAVLTSNQTEAQKQIALAQIQLGYSQLQQQMDMLREEYAQKLALAGLQL